MAETLSKGLRLLEMGALNGCHSQAKMVNHSEMLTDSGSGSVRAWESQGERTADACFVPSNPPQAPTPSLLTGPDR